MKCIECDHCHEVMLFRWSSDCNQFVDKEAYQCWGVKEPFVIDNIYKECSEYEYKRNKSKKEISAEDAIIHYKHGITHDIFSEPVTTYATLSIKALEKRIPQKPDIYGDGYWNGELVYDMGSCPSCGQEYEIEYHTPKYCWSCGQALDWSELDGN